MQTKSFKDLPLSEWQLKTILENETLARQHSFVLTDVIVTRMVYSKLELAPDSSKMIQDMLLEEIQARSKRIADILGTFLIGRFNSNIQSFFTRQQNGTTSLTSSFFPILVKDAFYITTPGTIFSHTKGEPRARATILVKDLEKIPDFPCPNGITDFIQQMNTHWIEQGKSFAEMKFVEFKNNETEAVISFMLLPEKATR